MLDRGIFDSTRTSRFSIHIQGVHGHSRSADVTDLPPRPHPEIQPWKDDGEFIQILQPTDTWSCPVPSGWLERACEVAEDTFDLPVKVKYHPRQYENKVALADTFEETYLSISYASKASIQTVIAGVPTIVQSSYSMAYPMCGHEMSRETPDGREEWLHALSYREYDFDSEDELDECAAYIHRVLSNRQG